MLEPRGADIYCADSRLFKCVRMWQSQIQQENPVPYPSLRNFNHRISDTLILQLARVYFPRWDVSTRGSIHHGLQYHIITSTAHFSVRCAT
jgi:hypothetical protein